MLTTILVSLGGGAIIGKLADRLMTKSDRENDEARKLRIELRAEVDRLTGRVQALEGRVETLTGERDTHRQAAGMAAGEVKLLRTQIESLEKENVELMNERDAALTECERLRGRVVHYEQSERNGRGEKLSG